MRLRNGQLVKAPRPRSSRSAAHSSFITVERSHTWPMPVCSKEDNPNLEATMTCACTQLCALPIATIVSQSRVECQERLHFANSVPPDNQTATAGIRLGCVSPQCVFSESPDGKVAAARLAALREEKERAIGEKNKALHTQGPPWTKAGQSSVRSCERSGASPLRNFASTCSGSFRTSRRSWRGSA
jgi:hypothetical protein